jgi:hypothetical protein
VSSGGPIEGKQEGESPAFRAGKGQAFPACEPRKGHCGSVGVKGQWGSPHEIEISLVFGELPVFMMSNPGNPRPFFPLKLILIVLLCGTEKLPQ